MATFFPKRSSRDTWISQIYSSASLRQGKMILGALLFCLFFPPASTGQYSASAHSSAVARQALTDAGYSTGNCGHCHEMHGSVAGSEPAPDGGGASPYALFAENFSGATSKPYAQADNFCFYCHNTLGTVQQVSNQDYSATFGGATSGSGPQSILAAFNLNSYHNLKDIDIFVRGKQPGSYSWYNSESNPCNTCHNPHLAKRNRENIPTQSAISKPSDHFNLWGESQLMSTAYPNQYEAPYGANTSVREPAGDTVIDGSKTPDYVSFCTDCHTSSDTSIYSTNLGRVLGPIDWTYDKHGTAPRTASRYLGAPFSTSGKANIVLSCLDCHEPHGSSNIMLIRRRVNGGLLSQTITGTEDMIALCARCHPGVTRIAMRTMHHDGVGAPYKDYSCGTNHCHGGPPGSNPIPCYRCHVHGGTDQWAFDNFPTKFNTTLYGVQKTF